MITALLPMTDYDLFFSSALILSKINLYKITVYNYINVYKLYIYTWAHRFHQELTHPWNMFCFLQVLMEL